MTWAGVGVDPPVVLGAVARGRGLRLPGLGPVVLVEVDRGDRALRRRRPLARLASRGDRSALQGGPDPRGRRRRRPSSPGRRGSRATLPVAGSTWTLCHGRPVSRTSTSQTTRVVSRRPVPPRPPCPARDCRAARCASAAVTFVGLHLGRRRRRRGVVLPSSSPRPRRRPATSVATRTSDCRVGAPSSPVTARAVAVPPADQGRGGDGGDDDVALHEGSSRVDPVRRASGAVRRGPICATDAEAQPEAT